MRSLFHRPSFPGGGGERKGREGRRVDYLLVQGDVEDDELDKALGVEEDAETEALAGGHAVEGGNEEGGADLCGAGGEDEDDEEPGGADVGDRRGVHLETDGGVEEGHHEAGDEVLEFLDQGRPHRPAGDHQPQDEGPEDGVDADGVGGEAADHHRRDEDANVYVVHRLALRRAAEDPRHRRLHRQIEHEHEGEAGEDDRQRRQQGPVSAGDGDGQREEDPRAAVVDDGDGRGDLPHLGGEQLDLRQDSTEDGERRHGEGDSQEEDQGAGLRPLGDARPEDEEGDDGHREGKDDPRRRQGPGLPPRPLHHRHVHLQPYQEHEVDQPHMADRLQHRHAPGGEDHVQVPGDLPHHRRPHNHAALP